MSTLLLEQYLLCSTDVCDREITDLQAAREDEKAVGQDFVNGDPVCLLIGFYG